MHLDPILILMIERLASLDLSRLLDLATSNSLKFEHMKSIIITTETHTELEN